MNEFLERATLPAQPRRRYFQTADQRSYTTAEVCGLFRIARSTFYDLRKQGKLPLVELPRLGRVRRYQAAPIDRYFRG